MELEAKNKNKKNIHKFIDRIVELESLIVVLIAIILVILHYFGALEEFASTSIILILLSLLTIHIVVNNIKQNEFIENIRNISEESFGDLKTFLKAYDRGFRQLHEKRDSFMEDALYDKIISSKKNTGIIAICLTILRERSKLSEKYIKLIVDKIIESPEYKFEFFLLRKDLYSQRATIEESNEDTLRRYRSASLFNLLWIKSQIYYRTKNIEDIKRVRIKEYGIMPTISEFLVDDTIYYGPYIARKCGDIPIVELKKTSDKSDVDLYKLFEDNYNRMNNLSNPIKFKIHNTEKEFDFILSEKIKEEYKIKKIYDIIQNEDSRDKYYREIETNKTFEEILEDIDNKISF